MSTNEPVNELQRLEKLLNKVGKITFVIAFIFFQLLFCTNPTILRNKTPGHQAQKAFAEGILTSLQSSAAIYVMQQHKKPRVFSNYVVISGMAKGAKTLTLENIRGQLTKKGITGIHSKTLTISFKPSGERKAKYYLNGSIVTAQYIGMD